MGNIVISPSVSIVFLQQVWDLYLYLFIWAIDSPKLVLGHLTCRMRFIGSSAAIHERHSG